MRFLRFGSAGQEKPALRDQDGVIRDISAHLVDITPAILRADSLAELSGIDLSNCPVVDRSERLGAPINGIGKFLAIGLNYSDHAKEVGAKLPNEPIIFTKAISCISGPNDDIVLPESSRKTDWEAELTIVIGERAKSVPIENGYDYIAGYMVCNDVSEREFQLERGGSWDKGKGCDTFGPLGPEFVTSDEVVDPHDLHIWLELNGETMQNGNTGTLIFKVNEIVSYVSRYITLEPGDIIATGTPPGVGMGRSPQRFLKPGDVVSLGISGLGEQRHEVVAT